VRRRGMPTSGNRKAPDDGAGPIGDEDRTVATSARFAEIPPRGAQVAPFRPADEPALLLGFDGARELDQRGGVARLGAANLDANPSRFERRE
jgi:hypothetical protein